MSEHEYKITREAGLARIDLNRPDEGNALTRAMMKSSEAAFAAVWDNEDDAAYDQL